MGICFFRIGKIDQKGSEYVSFLVLYISTPMLILESLLVPFEPGKLVLGVWILVLSGAVMLISAIVGKLFFKRHPLRQFTVVFSNVGFMGIPLVRSLLGNEAVFFMSLFNVVLTVLVWTYGVYLLTGSWKDVSLKKVILNPCILAVIVGLIFFVCGVHLPVVITETIHNLGNLNTGLAILLLGIYLAQTDLAAFFVKKEVWKISILRLVVVPLITLAMLVLIPIDNTGFNSQDGFTGGGSDTNWWTFTDAFPAVRSGL